jgi:acetyl-CoA/propionyl-CoA carboxylase biotin carboxyl carrier protein
MNRPPCTAASRLRSAGAGAAEPELDHPASTFVIEMNNRRVVLTVPSDIVRQSHRRGPLAWPSGPRSRCAGQGCTTWTAATRGQRRRPGVIAAPMQALVTRINVSEGQQVAKGDLLVVLESMKMENYVYAPVERNGEGDLRRPPPAWRPAKRC